MATELLTSSDFTGKGRGQRSRLATSYVLARDIGSQTSESLSISAAAQRISTALSQLGVSEREQRLNIQEELSSLDTIIHMNPMVAALALVYLGLTRGMVEKDILHGRVMTEYVQRVLNQDVVGTNISPAEMRRRQIEPLAAIVRYSRNIIAFRQERVRPS